MKSKKILYISLLIFLLAGILPYKRNHRLFINPMAILENNILQPKNSKYLEKSEVAFTRNLGVIENLEIQGEAAIVIDVTNQKVLFEKNANTKKPVASLVKMMTAIITDEYLDLEDTVTISKKAAETGENSMDLKEGEQFSVENLLYGLILDSANDSAVALAERVAGEESDFVK